ncbi:uncharacterized protein [Primulina huaijiensis]|uniref:uncharacterized protein n=1 Tax=Primulina huaijiensis TaxID=1492673 RepID=UPI003CC73003
MKTTKEIWEKLIQLCEGNEQTKENKLSVAVQKFDNIKMKTGESMNEFVEQVSSIINELNTLRKVYSNKEIALKVVRGLLKEQDVKTVTREGEPSTPPVTTSLSALKLELTGSTEKFVKQLSNDALSLFIKKFGRFMRKNQGSFQRYSHKNISKEEPNSCYNCGKIGYYIADCPKPKKDSRHSAEKEMKSFEWRRRATDDKRSFKRKHEALLAEENKSKWAENDSDESKSEKSSSSSDDEEVKCLMANDTELESSSEQVKAKQTDPQDNKIETGHYESVKLLSLEKDITELKAEMSENQSVIQQLKLENSRQNYLIQSATLTQMQDLQKSGTEKTSLGFNSQDESSTSGTKPKLNMCKEKYIHTVKSVMVTGTSTKNSIWYLDSGYLRHMTGDVDLLSQLIKYSGPKISFGDASQVSKAYRIFNKRTFNVEESIHVVVDESALTDKPTDPVELIDRLTEINLEDDSEEEVNINRNIFQTPELEVVDKTVEQEIIPNNQFVEQHDDIQIQTKTVATDAEGNVQLQPETVTQNDPISSNYR